MPRKRSRRLVIDASVARASGSEEATFPTSKHSRDFLKAVLTFCHHLVLSDALREEWDKHQSSFARRWRVSMNARKKVDRIDPPRNDDLRDKIERTATTDNEVEIMRKDLHLVEAGLASDCAVVALDEEVRELFHIAAENVGELRNLMWINPDRPEEEAISWLEKGAKVEQHRQLGCAQ